MNTKTCTKMYGKVHFSHESILGVFFTTKNKTILSNTKKYSKILRNTLNPQNHARTEPKPDQGTTPHAIHPWRLRRKCLEKNKTVLFGTFWYSKVLAGTLNRKSLPELNQTRGQPQVPPKPRASAIFAILRCKTLNAPVHFARSSSPSAFGVRILKIFFH
jgi:hypothetical protein